MGVMFLTPLKTELSLLNNKKQNYSLLVVQVFINIVRRKI